MSKPRKKLSEMAPVCRETIEKNMWKPGQSGNPKGKPKGAKNFKTVIKEILDFLADRAEADEDDRDLVISLENQLGRPVTRRELLVYKQYLAAVKGSTMAFNAIADREEGKPTQAIDLDADVDHSGTISHKVVGIEERVKQLKGDK